jgi:hypothetical protein
MTDEMPRLNIAELRIRIEHGPFGIKEISELTHELIALGSSAKPLLPLLISQYKSGRLMVPSFALVRLYAATQSEDLLALIKCPEIMGTIGLSEKCDLLQRGVSEVETDLLEALWRGWNNSGDLSRRKLVQSLGEAGGPKALKMLEVIHYRTAGEIPGQRMRLHKHLQKSGAQGPDASVESIELQANQEFLNEVRKAIERLQDRGIKGETA